MSRTPILLAVLAVLLAGCGDTAPAPTTAPVTWMQAKVGPIVGRLEAAVVARPGPDRVRLEARWTAGSLPGPCTVDLGLPVGVLIVEGPERLDLEVEDPGTAVWILEFPRDGRELDAVVRYCVETPEGLRAAHVAVRLTP